MVIELKEKLLLSDYKLAILLQGERLLSLLLSDKKFAILLKKLFLTII